MANAFRSLVQLAPGRVVCGIGVGDRPLARLGLPMAKLSTLERAVDVMRRLWAGESVSGGVGRWRLDGAHLRSPIEAPPVYIAASGPRALELTGRIADGAIILPGLFPEGLDFAREHLARGRALSDRPSLDTVCFLYGAIDADEARALDAARPIAAWFPKTAPAYARLAGMSDELIEAVVGAYEGQEFQDAAAAAGLISDDLVRKVAFAGTPAAAARKLEWLRESGIEAVERLPPRRPRPGDHRGLRRHRARPRLRVSGATAHRVAVRGAPRRLRADLGLPPRAPLPPRARRRDPAPREVPLLPGAEPPLPAGVRPRDRPGRGPGRRPGRAGPLQRRAGQHRGQRDPQGPGAARAA